MWRTQHTPLPVTASPGAHGGNTRSTGFRCRWKEKNQTKTKTKQKSTTHSQFEKLASIRGPCPSYWLIFIWQLLGTMKISATKQCLQKYLGLAGPLEGDKNKGLHKADRGSSSMPEVLVSHHGEERLLLDCPSHNWLLGCCFSLHFSKTTMNSCVCGTQPEATRTFLVQGEIERPRTESSSLHLSINCLDFINS